jgi:hypothetical protein
MARKECTKYHVRVRKFLNCDPQYPAFVIGIVEDTSGIPDSDQEQRWNWGNIELELGDCFRRVSFDFSMETRRQRANSLYKINGMAAAINAMRDAIEKEVHSRNARPRKATKKQK